MVFQTGTVTLQPGPDGGEKLFLVINGKGLAMNRRVAIKLAWHLRLYGRRAKVAHGDLSKDYQHLVANLRRQELETTRKEMVCPVFDFTEMAGFNEPIPMGKGKINLKQYYDTVHFTVNGYRMVLDHETALQLSAWMRVYARWARTKGEGAAMRMFALLKDQADNYNELIAPNLKFASSTELKGLGGGF